MNSMQRLLRAPRSFVYNIDEARATAGLRVGFVNVTDAADPQPKFYLDISDVSTGRLRFTFLNTDPGNWTITRVYFDDGEVMAIDVVMETAAATAEVAAAGGDTATGGRAALPGERPLHENLAVIFELHPGVSMADVVCALNAEGLKVSLKAVRPGSEESSIFTSAPELSLSSAPVP
jgi:hypothetical protein